MSREADELLVAQGFMQDPAYDEAFAFALVRCLRDQTITDIATAMRNGFEFEAAYEMNRRMNIMRDNEKHGPKGTTDG